MKFIPQQIPGIWLIEPDRFGDRRGYFSETFRLDLFRKHIGNVEFIQDNESLSSHGVLRGLHFQCGDAAQAKLVRVSQGAVLDVAVDLRRSSPSFGRHITVELSHDNGRQLFIPKGFAHGFAVLSQSAVFQYKVDAPYRPESERTLLFNDPALGILWPFSESEAILSPKDLNGNPLSETETFS